jgi:2-C-methyl-D-erythritol 4-phosphate cytidylyltransferase/2-C-methyl-D-erythritol 2,4-cyclodiphosphate synthase
MQESGLHPTVALIVASGRGERFGGEIAKQYLALAGRPVLRHALCTFARHPSIDAVRVVIHPDDRDHYEAAAADLDLLEAVAGGSTRQESVRLGLESLVEAAPARVLIHDGVRPLVDGALIDRVLTGLRSSAAVLPALPVPDTLKRVADGVVTATVDRQGLWRAQTPQGFAFGPILAAHRRFADQALTDDCALAEAAGEAVTVVAGAAGNLKITELADLVTAERWLAGRQETRTGQGFDVHRLVPGAGVRLLGIDIPAPFRLLGHSDADVGLHALTDALLGAIGAGDIGSHFPPSEARWAGCDSAVFLDHARDLIAAAGGRIVHVDVTLICERPRVGPHRPAMVAWLAERLGLASGRVSVKATTTEQLGFTGRGEGIAAQALATVLIPESP